MVRPRIPAYLMSRCHISITPLGVSWSLPIGSCLTWMNDVLQLITSGKRDLLSDIDSILWGTEPPSLSSIWIQRCVVSKQETGSTLHVFNCHVLIFFCCVDWLPPSLPCWAVTWFKIYCTGQFATGSSDGGREGRQRGGKKCRDRDSLPLPSPLCSPTLSTQRTRGCRWWLHSATAARWWRRELQLCVYKATVLPGQRCCQMGFEQRGPSDLWLDSLQLFIWTKQTAGDFTLLLHSTCSSHFRCIDPISCCCVWSK